ncbi:hypothetical protein [Rhizobium grahamii]|uniref:Uncharacterized protein n=1 Tax=Rhizobium grahamii TaxID=1120045 RepID=A0A370KI09_9HYPH|nr:hypothetical protein [Rhizobium grahamii]RDJ05059.1 hypothetical protein B5K06_26165 [Rhizobium grahamii]
MTSKLTLILPDLPGGSLVGTTVRNRKLIVVFRSPIGPLPTGLELEVGIYVVQVEAPDGRYFEAAFEVEEGAPSTEVVLEEVLSQTKFSHSPAPSRQSVGEAAPQVEAHHPVIVLADPAPPAYSLSLVTIDSDGTVKDSQTLSDRLPGVVEIERGAASRFVRISRFGQPDLFIAAPTSEEEGVKVKVKSIAPLALDLKLEGDRANLLFHYIANGRVDQLSDLVAEVWPRLETIADLGAERLKEFSELVSKNWSAAQDLFDGARSNPLTQAIFDRLPKLATLFGFERQAVGVRKLAREFGPQIQAVVKARHIKPVTATIAGYVFLLVGPPPGNESKRSSYGDTIDLLAELAFGQSPWLVDQLCIRAEALARRGQHEKALSLFLKVPDRGVPMFSMGLRFTLDRLKGYRTSARTGKLDPSFVARIEPALERLERLALGADFDQPLLTFLSIVPQDSPIPPAERESPMETY